MHPIKFKTWLMRIVGGSLILFILMKLTNSWILFDRIESETDHRTHLDELELDPLVQLRRHERLFYASHHEPKVKNRQCDACRIIAHHFDVAFEAAEEMILGIKPDVRYSSVEDELSEEEVNNVVNEVCKTVTFLETEPVVVQREQRLAAHGIETSYHLQERHFLDLRDEDHPDHEGQVVAESRNTWPQRLKARCRLLSDHFHGKEIYEMWLRTSAGTVDHFEEFLCFGAGIFSDCLVNRPEVWISDDKDELEDELKQPLTASLTASVSGNSKALKRRK